MSWTLAGDVMFETKMLALIPSRIAAKGDGNAVVSARRGRDAHLRHIAHQQIGKRAASFEGAGVLEGFQLEGERAGGGEAEIAGINGNGWRAPYVRPNNRTEPRSA